MHEKVAKLVIERATVIFNLLALGGPAGPVKDTMYWPGGLKSSQGQWASAYVEGCHISVEVVRIRTVSRNKVVCRLCYAVIM